MKLYRIYDTTTCNTVANAIPELEHAHEVLQLYQLDNPYNKYEIESYTKYTVTGLGRDPDLHEPKA
jgi:hypothetical protein